MASKIITLQKKQVKEVLERLHQEGVLYKDEYEYCISRATTAEKCVTLLETLKNKDGGLQALRASVAALPSLDEDQDDEASFGEGVRGILFLDVMDIQQEYTGILSRMDTTISEVQSFEEEEEQSKKETHVKVEEVSKIPEINQDQTNVGEKENKVSELQHLYPGMKKVFDHPLQFVELSENGVSRTVPVYCLRMIFDSARINTQYCQITYGGCFLINEPAPAVKQNANALRFRNYQGTVGSIPITIPASVSVDNPPPLQYWESDTVVELNGRLDRSYTLFEMGVCVERCVDRRKWVHNERQSWCIRIGVCTKHSLGICCQIWADQQQEGSCRGRVKFRTRGKCAELCYGVVVDVGKGRLAFLDLNEGRVLHTFTVAFKDTLLPVFAVQPLEKCSVKMDVKSGVDNVGKIGLIQKALQ